MNTPNIPAQMQKDPKAKYQHYKSSRVAMRLITTKGKKIIFTGYEFLTQDEEIIKYLDSEINQGLTCITKGGVVTLDDRDPMAAMKRKIIAEHEEKKAKEASDAVKGITQNMGKTEGPTGAKVGAVSTKNVAT